MNYRLIILMPCLAASVAVYPAIRKVETRSNQPKTEQFQTPNPIEEDKKLDNILFGHFVSILGNFGKLLLDPHDKVNVTNNVTSMINGVVAVAQELTKKPLSPTMHHELVMRVVRHMNKKENSNQHHQ